MDRISGIIKITMNTYFKDWNQSLIWLLNSVSSENSLREKIWLIWGNIVLNLWLTKKFFIKSLMNELDISSYTIFDRDIINVFKFFIAYQDFTDNWNYASMYLYIKRALNLSDYSAIKESMDNKMLICWLYKT